MPSAARFSCTTAATLRPTVAPIASVRSSVGRATVHAARRVLRAALIATALAACARDNAPLASGITTEPSIAAAVNVAPTPIFAISPRWPQPGDTVTFDARYSIDGDGLVVSYEWDLGNGAAQVTGAQAKTVFQRAGTYAVALTARDDSNATSSASMSLVVSTGGGSAGRVSASQSTLTLAAASVAAGTSPVAATVTARDASGAAIAGVPVRLGSVGRTMDIAQPSAVTPGSGVATGTVASRVAQSTSVRAIADYVLLDASAALSVVPAAVSATLSQVRRTDSLITKYGDSTQVEITARDANGNPVVGATVSLSLTGGSATVTNEGVTDANGRRVVRVFPTSCDGTVLTMQATVGSVTLTSQPIVRATSLATYGVCGATLWLDASDVSTITQSGGIVTQWRDKSAFLRHSTATAGPFTLTGQMAGRGVVRFNGVNQFVPITDVVSGTSYTVFVAERRRVPRTVNHMLGGSANVLNENLHVGYRTDIVGTSAHYNNDVNVAVSAFTSIAAEPARVWATRFASGARSIRINAGVAVSDATPNGVVSWVNASVGRYRSTNFYSGDIGEVLFFSRALTDAERLTVERALLAKWGAGTIAIDQGDNQYVPVGATVPIAPRVRVTDGSGTPVAGATITWQVTAGGGNVGTTTSTTDASGYATTSWTVGALTATNTLVAWNSTLAGQGQSVTFTAGAGGCAYAVCGASLWLDAADAATITQSAGILTQWLDKSGNARHATPAAGPAVTAAGLAGRTVLRFDGTSQSIPITDVVTGSPYTVLIVEKRRDNRALNLMVGGSTFGTNQNLFIGYRANTTTTLAHWGNDLDQTVSAFTTIASEPGRLWSSRWQSGARSQRINAGAASADATTNGLTAWAGAAIGKYGTSNWYNGDIAEVVFYRRALSDSERLAVELALMAKWGLGVYTLESTASQSATAGTSPSSAPRVRLVAVSGGDPIPGAQVTWQVTAGGGRISGATTLMTTTDASGYASIPAGQWVLDAGSNTVTAYLSGTAGQGRTQTFTATGTLPSGLTMQFDASDTTTLLQSSACTGAISANTDAVGCWLDKSGNAYHASQSITTDRPVVNTAGIGGRRSIGFTLTRENWLGVTNSTVRNLRSTAHTIVAVARSGATENATVNDISAIAVWQGFHNGLEVKGYPNATVLQQEHWARADGGASIFPEASSVTPGVPFVGSIVLSFSSATTFTGTTALNGVAGSSQTATDPTPGGAADFRIGQGNSSPESNFRFRLDGRIGEIIVFNRALSNAERVQVERYLGWKWGITVP
jgi:PKD domain/Bacterial Ig-like domain (group 1)